MTILVKEGIICTHISNSRANSLSSDSWGILAVDSKPGANYCECWPHNIIPEMEENVSSLIDFFADLADRLPILWFFHFVVSFRALIF